MVNRKSVAACSAVLFMALAGCQGGQGGNDTLVDGATDKPRSESANAAEDVGPPTAPVQSASPATGNSVGQPGAGMGAAGAAGGATLAVKNHGPHGQIVTDAAGNALYYLEGDRDGSKCVGPCVQAWPPVAAGGTQPTGAAGLQGAMIATVSRPDGTRQVTFAGHPLYRYAADAGAGTANGDNVKDKFGTWRLATPAMSAMNMGGAGTQQGGASPASTGTAHPAGHTGGH